MNIQVYDANGVKRQWWDDEGRTYFEYNAQGVQTISRPYTAAESAETDAEVIQLGFDANRTSIGVTLADALAELQAIIDDTNTNINSNPAQRIKAMARAQRRIIRLLTNRPDGRD